MYVHIFGFPSQNKWIAEVFSFQFSYPPKGMLSMFESGAVDLNFRYELILDFGCISWAKLP